MSQPMPPQKPKPRNWKGTRVLITGAGGFIGSHLAERLVREGADVRAFIHYNASGHRGWLENSPTNADMRFFYGDICDRDTLPRAMEAVDVVFHLAALISIPYSSNAPFSYVRTNIEGTMNVLNAARAAGAAKLVHTSTSEVYGEVHYVPLDERHPLTARSPYAASKIGADKMVEALGASFGFPVTTVRPFNTYGPRQSERAIVPSIIHQALSRSEISLGNLSPTRDMNFVEDTVQGFMLASDSTLTASQPVNLGSGHELTIGDLAHLILKLMGRELPIVSETVRVRTEPTEVHRLIADSRFAAAALGWKPEVDLEAGLVRTIEWFKENPPKESSVRYRV